MSRLPGFGLVERSLRRRGARNQTGMSSVCGEDVTEVRALIVTNMWPTEEAPQFGSFVADQVAALRRRGDVEIEVFSFPPGPRALARATREIRRRHATDDFDVVHAHFGLAAYPALA